MLFENLTDLFNFVSPFKKMAHWTVTGHGYENPDVTFVVPEGVTVNFYVNEGKSLLILDAVLMWRKLRAEEATDYGGYMN